jgi:HK97 family phage major capsid protein
VRMGAPEGDHHLHRSYRVSTENKALQLDELRAKAAALVNDQPVVDADGNPVNITEIKLITGQEEAVGEEQAPAEDAKGVADIVREEVERATKSFRGFAAPAALVEPARPRRKVTKCFSDDETALDFAATVSALCGNRRARKALESRYGAKALMSSNDDGAGGILVPLEVRNDIIRLVEEYGVARKHCFVVPMKSDTLSYPRRTSGVTISYVGEATETASTPTGTTVGTDSIQLVLRKTKALVKIPQDLISDSSVALADLVAREIALEQARVEDTALFNGDGTSTYGGQVGVLNHVNTANTYTAATGNTAFSTLDVDDFIGTVAQVPAYALGNAKWYISAAGFAAAMQRLAYAAGGNTVQNITGGTGFSFLGYPVVISQVLNSTLSAQASAKVAVFGDLSMGCLFGSRDDLMVETNASAEWVHDRVLIKGTTRWNVVCHSFDSASTAGPVSVLKLAAS